MQVRYGKGATNIIVDNGTVLDNKIWAFSATDSALFSIELDSGVVRWVFSLEAAEKCVHMFPSIGAYGRCLYLFPGTYNKIIKYNIDTKEIKEIECGKLSNERWYINIFIYSDMLYGFCSTGDLIIYDLKKDTVTHKFIKKICFMNKIIQLDKWIYIFENNAEEYIKIDLETLKFNSYTIDYTIDLILNTQEVFGTECFYAEKYQDKILAFYNDRKSYRIMEDENIKEHSFPDAFHFSDKELSYAIVVCDNKIRYLLPRSGNMLISINEYGAVEFTEFNYDNSIERYWQHALTKKNVIFDNMLSLELFISLPEIGNIRRENDINDGTSIYLETNV